jgi:hypothetical protein
MKTDLGDPDRLSEQAAASRARLDDLVSELDQRRHVVTRAKSTLEARPLEALAGGLALLLGAAGVVWAVVKRRRQQHRLGWRGRRLGRAFSRMIDHPDRVASRDPTMGGKLMTTVATTVLAALTKRALDQVLRPGRPR